MGKFSKWIGKNDQAWLDWLSDDPPPTEAVQSVSRPRPVTREERLRFAGDYQRPPVVNQVASAPKTPTAAPQKAVTINVTFTRPKMPERLKSLLETTKQYARRIQPKHLMVAGSCVACAALAIGVGGYVTRKARSSNASEGVAVSTIAASKVPFKVLVPLDKPELATADDPTKALYNPEKKVYSYQDLINAVPVIVSQQEEPEKVSADPDGLKNLAKSMSALQSVDTTWGEAYIATNAKTESQTVVFVTNGLLIFLQSGTKHDAQTWKFYINNLEFSKQP